MRQAESSRDTVQRRKNSCLRDAFLFLLLHTSRQQPIAVIGGRCRSRADNLQPGTVEWPCRYTLEKWRQNGGREVRTRREKRGGERAKVDKVVTTMQNAGERVKGSVSHNLAPETHRQSCNSWAKLCRCFVRRDKLSTDFFATKYFTRQAVSITSCPIKDITAK